MNKWGYRQKKTPPPHPSCYFIWSCPQSSTDTSPFIETGVLWSRSTKISMWNNNVANDKPFWELLVHVISWSQHLLLGEWEQKSWLLSSSHFLRHLIHFLTCLCFHTKLPSPPLQSFHFNLWHISESSAKLHCVWPLRNTVKTGREAEFLVQLQRKPIIFILKDFLPFHPVDSETFTVWIVMKCFKAACWKGNCLHQLWFQGPFIKYWSYLLTATIALFLCSSGRAGKSDANQRHQMDVLHASLDLWRVGRRQQWP